MALKLQLSNSHIPVPPSTTTREPCGRGTDPSLFFISFRMHKNQINSLAALFLFTAVVAGCGGGGDSSPVAPAATVPVKPVAPAPTPVTPTLPVTPVAPVTPVVVTPTVATVTASLTVPMVTSVPTPTYAVGSEELAAFNLLNAERLRCGFGMLAQNASLDVAAKGHADWLLRNGFVGHGEVANTPLFTGVDPFERFAAAGYAQLINDAFNANEVITWEPSPDKVGFGIRGTRRLLNAPYHMVGMLRPDVDVGIALRSSNEVALSKLMGKHLVIDTGVKYSKVAYGLNHGFFGQVPTAQDSVRTYPCEGSSGTDTRLLHESPNPTPSRNLALSPLGVSVGVVLQQGHTLALTKATMIEVLTGASIELLALDNYLTNGNVNYLPENEGFITANSPLGANLKYKVEIIGKDNGAAFTKTFTFTTGAAQ